MHLHTFFKGQLEQNNYNEKLFILIGFTSS
jgi:hypothetical protein